MLHFAVNGGIDIEELLKFIDNEIEWVHGGILHKKAEQFGRTAEEMIDGTEELFMPKNKAFQAQQIDRDMLQGKEKQYQGVEKYTLRDGKEHTFVVTRTLFSFGDEKLILNSALDISELKETQSSLLHTKDDWPARICRSLRL